MNINQNQPNQPVQIQTPDTKKTLDTQRRGKVFRLRLLQGVKSLVKRPLCIIPIVLLLAAFSFCWLKRDWLISLLPFNFSGLPNVMYSVVTYALYAFIILVFLLLIAMVLQIIGTPRMARKIDRGLINLFRHDTGDGDWPIYLTCRQEKGIDLFTHTFYSEFVPLECWQEKQKSGKLVSLLGGYIDSIHYGGKDKDDTDYIVVVSGTRAEPKKRPATPDPLFREGMGE